MTTISADRPSTAELLAQLTSAAAAVRGDSWLAEGLGRSSAAMGLLGSASSPLSGLSASGLGWFQPYVSFLEEPFNQLRGNPGSVSSGAQEFQDAGQSVSSLASSYRGATSAQTGNWSGSAASAYRDAGSQHADGIAALGQANTTVADAIAAAGEVVGQAVEAITQLVTEAVGKIVPIMTQAVAAAPATFGQSIAAAIPQCVQIAVDCGQKILAKLTALLASGQNLLKLVKGALAVVDVVKKVLSQISKQSSQGQSPTQATETTQKAQTESRTPSAAQETGVPASSASAVPMSTNASTTGGTPSGYVPTRTSAMPRTGLPTETTYPGNHTRTAGFAPSAGATSGGPSGFGFGGVPVGSGPTNGSSVSSARRGLGVGNVAPLEGKEMTAGRAPANASGTSGTGMMGGTPMGVGAQREEDKEHQRRYAVAEDGEEAFGLGESFVIAPEVIGEERG